MHDLVVFGASVSAQIGPNSYVHYLNELTNSKCKVFGFGGYQMEFAHLLCDTVNKALTNNSLLLIEWFTPVKTYNDEDIKLYLGSLLYNFYGKKVLCVLLQNNTAHFFQGYQSRIIKFLKLHCIPYLNLLDLRLEKGDIKVDGVHTLEGGGKKYANEIYNYVTSTNIQELTYCIPTFYSNNVQYKECVMEVGINETLKITSNEKNGIIKEYAIEMEIGPFSGYVDVNGFIFKLWDKWCGKTRKTLKMGNILLPLTIKPVQKDFDRSISAIQVLWEPCKFKMLGIYYPKHVTLEIVKLTL